MFVHQIGKNFEEMKLLLVLAVLIFSCSSLPWEDTSIIEIKESIANDEEFVRFNYHEEHIKETSDDNIVKKSSNLTLGKFIWKSCSKPSDPIQLKTLAISPDPIVIPGTVTATIDATILTTVQTATSLVILLKKSIFGVFIEIPCVDNFGSCTYEDPCGLLAKVTCPPQLVKLGWTCRCPIPAKHYVVPATPFKIPKLPLPPTLEDGDYEITATLKDGDAEIACFQITASLKAN